MADAELRAKLGAAARGGLRRGSISIGSWGEILEVYREAVLRAEVRRSKIEDRR
jgi:hypothetical protein